MKKILANSRYFWWQLLALSFLFLVFVILPEDYFSRLPVDLCLIKLIFHRECWGCGSLRAFSHLMHGHIAAAWQSNRLIFLWLILLLIFEFYWLVKLNREGKNGG